MNSQKLPATIASVVLVIAIVLLVRVASFGIDLYRKMDGLIVRQVDGRVEPLPEPYIIEEIDEQTKQNARIHQTPANMCERDFLRTHQRLDFDIVVWCIDHPNDYDANAASIKR